VLPQFIYIYYRLYYCPAATATVESEALIKTSADSPRRAIFTWERRAGAGDEVALCRELPSHLVGQHRERYSVLVDLSVGSNVCFPVPSVSELSTPLLLPPCSSPFSGLMKAWITRVTYTLSAIKENITLKSPNCRR
jgi:hypothetical protein